MVFSLYLCQTKDKEMRKNRLIIALLAVLLVLPCVAQKKGTARRKAAPVVVEPTEEELRYQEMLEATQRILFIDSVVVNKQQFLQAYRLTGETGTVSGYNQFFNTDDQPYSIVYLNQLGNKCWYSRDGRLYTADRLESRWSEPLALEGLGRFQRTNYPFMLADGLTLYFAAISNDGLGGLDIYVSRYDSESGTFLKAENIGLPFNSAANDYMFAVDEFSGVGYFATDRRQPEGKVCIYTFVPNQKRITYSVDDLGEETVKSLAAIERIADTWGDGEQRNEVLRQLNTAAAQPPVKAKTEGDFAFVINDNTVYTSINDFRNADNKERYIILSNMQKRLREQGSELDKMRVYYASKAGAEEKERLRGELQNLEQQYYLLEAEIHRLEKLIRNSEIGNLTN